MIFTRSPVVKPIFSFGAFSLFSSCLATMRATSWGSIGVAFNSWAVRPRRGPGEIADARRLADQEPGVLVDLHVDDEVAGIELPLDHPLLAPLELRDLFRGHDHVAEKPFQPGNRHAPQQPLADRLLAVALHLEDVPVHVLRLRLRPSGSSAAAAAVSTAGGLRPRAEPRPPAVRGQPPAASRPAADCLAPAGGASTGGAGVPRLAAAARPPAGLGGDRRFRRRRRRLGGGRRLAGGGSAAAAAAASAVGCGAVGPRRRVRQRIAAAASGGQVASWSRLVGHAARRLGGYSSQHMRRSGQRR